MSIEPPRKRTSLDAKEDVLRALASSSVEVYFRLRCRKCGYWNRMKVLKHFIQENSPDLKVSMFAPYYEPLKIETCGKCKTVVAEPKTLIRRVPSR